MARIMSAGAKAKRRSGPENAAPAIETADEAGKYHGRANLFELLVTGEVEISQKGYGELDCHIFQEKKS